MIREGRHSCVQYRAVLRYPVLSSMLFHVSEEFVSGLVSAAHCLVAQDYLDPVLRT